MDSSGDWVIAISTASAVLATASFLWAVVSWRRDGPRFRIHALLYNKVLLIWIFNSGRMPGQIEQIVIGGRRGGIGGHDLSEAMQCPRMLAPGQAIRVELDPATDLPISRHQFAAKGWDSLWLLLGSMQQRRAEVLPIPHDRPPKVGWRLAPRTARLSRYRPIFAAIVLFMAASSAMTLRVASASVLFLLLVFGWFKRAGRPRPQRRTIEACALILAFVLSLIIDANLSKSHIVSTLIVAYLALAVILALPGAVAEILDQVKRAYDRVSSFSRRFQ